MKVAASAVAERYRVPMVAAHAAAPAVYERGFKHIFGTLTPVDQYTANMIRMAVEAQPRAQRIALVHENALFPQAGIDAAEQQARAAGLEVVYKGGYPSGTKDFSAMLAARNRVATGPEDRALQERCITYGSPSLVAGYQSAYEIVQTSDTVALTLEMIHDTRVIPLDRRPHLAAAVRQWLGDSRGHWEGDTLVVETANYKPRSFMSRSSEQLHVIERFSQTGPGTLKYEITINDPGTWTKPWSLMIPLSRADHPMYEYGCHEGNYGMAGILTRARAEERAAHP